MTDIKDFGRTSLVTHTTGLIERMEKRTMNEQQEKILAVLDMSKDEQVKWIAETFVPKYGYRINLADLAFRLRDEADAHRMHDAMYLVQQNTKDAYNVLDYATAFWGLYHAKPIHWIIAALLAKESK